MKFLSHFFRPLPSSWLVPSGCLLLAVAAGCLPGALDAQSPTVDTAFTAPVFTSQSDPGGVVVLPDGRFYVFSGASNPFVGFDRLDGAARGNLLRFNADGSLDTTFAFDASLHLGTVTVAAPTTGGQLIVGVSLGFTVGSKVYRLNADGSVDPSFNPGSGTTGLFRALAVQADGKVLIGGSDTIAYNGTAATDFQRLNSDGSVDTTFNVVLDNAGTSQPVYGVSGLSTEGAIQVQPDGRIIIVGGFNRVNGVTVPAVARLNADGSVDAGFVPSGFSILSSPTSTYARSIRTAVVQPDGKIILGGSFNATSSSNSQPMVRLNANGSVDSSFNAPSGFGSGFHIKLQADGKVLLSTTGGGDGRYNANGSADTAFTLPAFEKMVSGFEGPASASSGFGYLPGGKILFIGSFDLADGNPRSGLARLNANGSLDTSFNPGKLQSDNAPARLAARADGTILASGGFDAANGQPRAGLALLNAAGTLNAAILPTPFFTDTYDTPPDFLLQPDGKVFLYGSTPTDSNGNTGFTYLRLNADLSVDSTLTADSDATPFGSAIYRSGPGYSECLVSPGVFNSVAAITEPFNFFLRVVNANGQVGQYGEVGIDTSAIMQGFTPGNGSNATIAVGNDTVLAIQADDKILYKYFDLTSNYRLVRLNADATLDTSFQVGEATPGVAANYGFTNAYDIGGGYEQANEISAGSDGISGLIVQSDGKLLVYGDLTQYNGQPVGGMLRLNPDGSRDTGFGAGTGPGGVSGAGITDLKVLADGKLLAVGNFQSFSGVNASGIARLNADGSVDGSFQVPGLAYKQADIGVGGTGGAGSPRLAAETDGSYLLTGNFVTASGQGPGSIIHLVGIDLVSSFFNGQASLGNGVYYLSFANGNYFGYYSYLSDPHYVYHFDLGYEYIFDAADGAGGVYFYDFTSNDFFYTSPTFGFPYLYDFGLQSVVYYYPDSTSPGHYNTNGYRFFYVVNTGQIITK